MAALTATAVPVAGGATLEDALTAAAALGDTAPTGAGYVLVVVNGDASPHTATIATPGTASGLAIADAALVVAAGETGIIPLSRRFAGASGRASITYDAVTSVQVGVLALGRD